MMMMMMMTSCVLRALLCPMSYRYRDSPKIAGSRDSPAVVQPNAKRSYIFSRPSRIPSLPYFPLEYPLRTSQRVPSELQTIIICIIRIRIL